ncbi:MAG: monovalent cation/H(+) antiporter subunit G [Pseudomonadota bacterium]
MIEFFQALASYWAIIRPIAGAAFCLIGGFLALVGAIGVLRFPDFYTRLHAASVTDTGAVLSLVLGMALLSPTGFIFIKVLAVGIFLFVTGPAASHAVANAAHTAKLEPLTGHFGRVDDPEDGTPL